MPELPDVEVFKQYVDATSLHQKIDGVRLLNAGMLQGASKKSLAGRVSGRELSSTRRHGKHLFIEVGDAGSGSGKGFWLGLHFGMTGWVEYSADDSELPEYAVLSLHFDSDRRFVYASKRRLGSIRLVDDLGDFIEDEKLGPDAMSVNAERLRSALEGHSGSAKARLMDQSLIAGIGNIYADEILFQLGLDPGAKVENLEDGTVGRMSRVMKRVLRRAIKARCDPERMPKSYLLPHREVGAECPKCGGSIKKRRISGRATYYCSKHQRKRT